MKTSLPTLLRVALLAAAPLGLVAQTTQPGSPARTTPATDDREMRYAAGDSADWGPREGDRELTLGGSGFTSKDIDNSSGGINVSYGWYVSDTLEVLVRQGITYVNSDAGSASWAGSTRVAVQQHIMARGPLRPFVGANFGGVYGDDTNETWVAGLEAGAKYYVKPDTFIFGLIDYGWAFNDADDAEDTFGDGGFTWSLGIGYNF